MILNTLCMVFVYILAGLTVISAVSLFYYIGKEKETEVPYEKPKAIEFDGYSRWELDRIVRKVQKNERNRKGYRFY